MRNIIIIWRKEVIETLRDKKVVIPFLIFPVIMLAVFAFALRETLNNPTALETVMSKLLPLFLMIIGIVASAFSLGIAVETFVGEKERKTFEPLLAVPISDRELFIGKCLASVLMPIFGAYMLEFLFVAMTAIQFARANVQFVLPVGQILFVVILIPLIGLLMCSVVVMISARLSSVKSAGQISGFAIIPFILFFQNAGPAIMRSNEKMVLTVATLAVIDALMLYIGSRTFQREKLISSL